MARFRRFEIVENPHCYFLQEASIFTPPRALTLNPFSPSFSHVEHVIDSAPDLLSINPTRSISFDDFGTITDLIRIEETPFTTSARRLTWRFGHGGLYLQALSDRVSALELGLDRLVREEEKKIGERKYSWTAEIKRSEKEQKYKWVTEIKDGKKGLDKSYKWTAEIKGKGAEGSPFERTYTIKVSNGDSSIQHEDKKKKKKKKKKIKKTEKVKEKKTEVDTAARIVEIEEPSNLGGIVLRQAFAKRVEKKRGKRKDVSLQDASVLIQKTFRAYLIRRSQALRALRELAIAKNKLKEIRALFNNFTYRRRVSRDAEERQRFSEKIIVLLLTVDAIEGADLMVRSAKKSMVDELEAMLDIVDPQPSGKSLSTRRRTFDMANAVINKELAAGVARVVRMLDQEGTSSESFEVSL